MKDSTMIDGKLYEPEMIDISKPQVEERSISIKLACVFGFILLICLSFYLIDPVANMGHIWGAKLKSMVGIEVVPAEIPGIVLKEHDPLTGEIVDIPLASTHILTPNTGAVRFQDGTPAVFGGQYSVSMTAKSVEELLLTYRSLIVAHRLIETSLHQALRIAANKVTYADMSKNPDKFGNALKEAISELELPSGITYDVTLKKVSIEGIARY